MCKLCGIRLQNEGKWLTENCGKYSWYILGPCTSTSVSLGRLKNTTRNLTQNRQSLLWYLYRRTFKCETEVVTSQLYSSVPDTLIHENTLIILLINTFTFNQKIYAIWVDVLTLLISYIYCVSCIFFVQMEDMKIYTNKHGSLLI
jgi:hypothetical protein